MHSTSTPEQESIAWIIQNAPADCADEIWLEAQDLLSPLEKNAYAALRFPKRRCDWLLGRYAAKKLLLEISTPPLTYAAQQFSILNSPLGDPYVLLPNQEKLEGCLSISHTDGAAFCAWTSSPTCSIGADIETIASRPHYFIEDYFTPTEIAQCTQTPAELLPCISTAIWSAKEAVLKALRQGLKWDTRKVEIDLSNINLEIPAEGTWQSARVILPCIEEKTWRLWIQRRQAYILSLACLE